MTATEALVSIAQTVLRQRIIPDQITRVDVLNAIQQVWPLLPDSADQNAAFAELCRRYCLA
jgi:hypothetical protein